jgi:hypothetical protein
MSKNGNSTEKATGEIIRAKELPVLDYNRYRLPRLLRLTRRVTTFSPECDICRGLQVQITQLGTNLPDQLPMTRQSLKEYLHLMKSITRHLKRSHGLVEERFYVKRYIFIGFTFGISIVLLGLILLSFGITLLALNITVTALITRVMFGYTVGYFLDRNAKKQGRVL